MKTVYSEKFNKELPLYVFRIRALRMNHGLSQEQVAQILGTSQTMYARYERGANDLPIHHLVKLCEYYGVTTDSILM